MAKKKTETPAASGAGDDSGSDPIESAGPIDPPDEGDAHDNQEPTAAVEGHLPEPVEPLPWLLFDELIFRDGLNLTVRHGTKWLGFKGDVRIGVSEDGPSMAIGEVVDTLYVSRFEDLNNDNLILRFEHDPDCRGFYDLVKTMQRCYPKDHVANTKGFTREDSVTLVFFVLRIVSEGVPIEAPMVAPDLEEVAQVPEERIQSRTMEGHMMLAKDVR